MALRQITLSVTRSATGDPTKLVWEETPLYCPNCGARTVWCESGEGDYYRGPDHGCTSCRHSFALPGGVDEAVEGRAQILEAIVGATSP